MAAMVKTHKPRTLRALSVDAILAHVARFDVRESSRAKADAALMDDSGDGALHRVTMLKALGRVELARGFVGLPRFRAATAGFLAAAGGAKGVAVFDALREGVAASTDILAIEAAAWLVEDIVGAKKLKRDRGPELASQAKNAAKRTLKACGARLSELRRPAAAPETSSGAPVFAATDCRVDQQSSPTREADMADYMAKLSVRVHPDRRKNLGTGHG